MGGALNNTGSKELFKGSSEMNVSFFSGFSFLGINIVPQFLTALRTPTTNPFYFLFFTLFIQSIGNCLSRRVQENIQENVPVSRVNNGTQETFFAAFFDI